MAYDAFTPVITNLMQNRDDLIAWRDELVAVVDRLQVIIDAYSKYIQQLDDLAQPR
jgi:ABC-type transporter Mla subunit MlaD